MAKGKGFDPIADAHEVAAHNINPYYWVNKVTSFTYARWMAEKKVAVVFAPVFLVTSGLVIWQLPRTIRDGNGLQAVGYLALQLFITIVYVIMAVQWWQSRGKTPPKAEARPERKKKHPRRRKDYH